MHVSVKILTSCPIARHECIRATGPMSRHDAIRQVGNGSVPNGTYEKARGFSDLHGGQAAHQVRATRGHYGPRDVFPARH